MNWKLIAGLSLAGVLMGFASAYGLPTKMEPFLWLPFFLLSAWLIARHTEKRAFLHGFLAGLINCVWMTLILYALSAKFMATHPVEAQLFAKMLAKNGTPIMVSILMTSIGRGIMEAVVLGVFANMAAGFVKKMA